MSRGWRAVARRTSRWLIASCAAVMLLAPITPAAAQTLADGQWWRTQWEMDRVWQISDGGGVTVAVLDSGMDPSVPELAGAMLTGVDLIGADPENANHGTGVASLIAGHGGDRGFRGVAPAAGILPIIIAGDRLGSDKQIYVAVQAIRYAVDNGAHVINISQGGPGLLGRECPEPVVDAVRYAADSDVIVVAGSGNNAGGEAPYPGSCPGILTVGATDPGLDPWPDSHRSEYVDVAAAGTNLSFIGAGGQERMGTGTSYATALVSGVIALVRAEFPEASADEILRRIIYTAGDIHTPGRDDATGYGIVQPIHALAETVPADAPNPVFERLYATGEPPDRSHDGPLATGGPPMAEAAPESSSGTDWLAVGVIGVFATLVVVGIVLALTVSRRRRPAQPHPYPYRRPPVPPPPGPPRRPYR